MADDTFVHLPDDSYLRIPEGTDPDTMATVKSTMMKKFPSIAVAARPQFTGRQDLRKVVSGVSNSMHPSYLVGDADKDSTPPDLGSMVKETGRDMLKASAPNIGYQMLKKAGMPPSETIEKAELGDLSEAGRAGGRLGSGMLLGAPEGAEVGEAAPRPQALSRPTTSAPAMERVPSAGAASRTPVGDLLNVTQHIPGKIGLGSRILRKFGVGNGAEVPEPDAAMTGGSAGGFEKGPVSQWGKNIEQPKSGTARTEPAWRTNGNSGSAAPAGQDPPLQEQTHTQNQNGQPYRSRQMMKKKLNDRYEDQAIKQKIEKNLKYKEPRP